MNIPEVAGGGKTEANYSSSLSTLKHVLQSLQIYESLISLSVV